MRSGGVTSNWAGPAVALPPFFVLDLHRIGVSAALVHRHDRGLSPAIGKPGGVHLGRAHRVWPEAVAPCASSGLVDQQVQLVLLGQLLALMLASPRTRSHVRLGQSGDRPFRPVSSADRLASHLCTSGPASPVSPGRRRRARHAAGFRRGTPRIQAHFPSVSVVPDVGRHLIDATILHRVGARRRSD